jgi:uncharacterized protein
MVGLAAEAAFDRGDYQTGLKLLEPLAEHHIYIAVQLAVIYEDGKFGVPHDEAKANQWWRKAADHGDEEAQILLAEKYIDGHAFGLAAEWFRKAADAGNPDAQVRLGLLYERGDGVPQDYVLSYMWFSLAAATSTVNDEHRDEVAAKMTREQIAEGQRLARAWKATK